MRSSKAIVAMLIGGTIILIVILRLASSTPEERTPPSAAPLVRSTVAESGAYHFSVTTHGAVSPRTESDLIPQVSGEVLWISPSLAAGGFFEAGDLLVRIDNADYRVDRESARAAVARSRSERDRALKELKRQQTLADRSVASQSRIDDAGNASRVAEASLRESQAKLERAQRDLARTKIHAPYRGRVRNKQVDVGQFVTRGAAMAKLYAVDFAEIRLPIPDRELAYLDIPLIPQAAPASERLGQATPESANAPDAESTPTGPLVDLRTTFAGEEHHWQGRLVRTEGELDPRSRMVHLVARVADPYGLTTPHSAPLAVGLFVEAEIEGITIEGAFALPRDALRANHQIYVIDSESRLQFRDVDVVRIERDKVIVQGGLETGERVCISLLQAAIDGMQVRLVSEEPDLAQQGDEPSPATPETIQ